MSLSHAVYALMPTYPRYRATFIRFTFIRTACTQFCAYRYGGCYITSRNTINRYSHIPIIGQVNRRVSDMFPPRHHRRFVTVTCVGGCFIAAPGTIISLSQETSSSKYQNLIIGHSFLHSSYRVFYILNDNLHTCNTL